MIDAALVVLDKRGYDDLNIEAVATQAGLSVGAPYGYFLNKEAVIVAVAQQVADKVAIAADPVLCMTDMSVSAVQWYIGYLATLLKEHPGLLTLPPGTVYQVLVPGLAGPFAAILERGRQAGKVRAAVEPELAAMYHVGAMLTVACCNPQWGDAKLSEFAFYAAWPGLMLDA